MSIINQKAVARNIFCVLTTRIFSPFELIISFSLWIAIASTVTVAAADIVSSESELVYWGSEEEYGEFLASPQELAVVPVNIIAKSMRMHAQAMKLGATVYDSNCASCHGSDLKGLAGQHTADLTDDIWTFSGDDLASVGRNKQPSDVEWTVRYGVRSGHPNSRAAESSMLAFDPDYRSKADIEVFGTKAYLSSAEISDMVELVLQLSGQEHDTVKAHRAENLFADNTKGNCVDCHGRDGRGSVVFGTTNLTKKDLYRYGSDRDSIRESITKGRHSMMPAFDDKLKPEEIKAVSIYVFSHASAKD